MFPTTMQKHIGDNLPRPEKWRVNIKSRKMGNDHIVDILIKQNRWQKTKYVDDQ